MTNTLLLRSGLSGCLRRYGQRVPEALGQLYAAVQYPNAHAADITAQGTGTPVPVYGAFFA